MPFRNQEPGTARPQTHYQRLFSHQDSAHLSYEFLFPSWWGAGLGPGPITDARMRPVQARCAAVVWNL